VEVSKPFRDVQYSTGRHEERERAASVITNYLILEAQTLSVGASLERATARTDGEISMQEMVRMSGIKSGVASNPRVRVLNSCYPGGSHHHYPGGGDHATGSQGP
jgi:hypothetical protein